MKAYTTPYGGVEEPMDPVLYMLTYGASFVAQTLATNVKMTAQLIKEGMEHRGFSFINVMSHCPTFNAIDDAKYFKETAEQVQESHDVSDIDAAMHAVNMAHKNGRIPVGLLYRTMRPTLDENMAELVKQAGGGPDYDLRKIIDLARP
jgi:2-oxoglutarate ferredoxin oxidoreductase subunit beta